MNKLGIHVLFLSLNATSCNTNIKKEPFVKVTKVIEDVNSKNLLHNPIVLNNDG